MLGYTYWQAKLKYGHVGMGKEITVSRYIQMPEDATIIDVWDLVTTMPGVKNNGVRSLKPIDEITYYRGKKLEDNNYYIQKLKSHKKKACS